MTECPQWTVERLADRRRVPSVQAHARTGQRPCQPELTPGCHYKPDNRSPVRRRAGRGPAHASTVAEMPPRRGAAPRRAAERWAHVCVEDVLRARAVDLATLLADRARG